MRITGINPSQVYSATDLVQGKAPAQGTRGADKDGNEYVLCKVGTGGTGVIGAVGFLAADFTWTAVSTANDGPGQQLAVARAVALANEFCWCQIWGRGAVRALANAAADARLNTTGTAGALDDDNTAGSFAATGIVLTTAVGGAADSVAANINYPQLATAST